MIRSFKVAVIEPVDPDVIQRGRSIALVNLASAVSESTGRDAFGVAIAGNSRQSISATRKGVGGVVSYRYESKAMSAPPPSEEVEIDRHPGNKIPILKSPRSGVEHSDCRCAEGFNEIAARYHRCEIAKRYILDPADIKMAMGEEIGGLVDAQARIAKMLDDMAGPPREKLKSWIYPCKMSADFDRVVGVQNIDRALSAPGERAPVMGDPDESHVVGDVVAVWEILISGLSGGPAMRFRAPIEWGRVRTAKEATLALKVMGFDLGTRFIAARYVGSEKVK